MKAIQVEAFGNPVEVVDVPDVGAPAKEGDSRHLLVEIGFGHAKAG
jgi:hypothetical protein